MTKSNAAAIARRTFIWTFALCAAFGPARAFGQLSVDELEVSLRPENAKQRGGLIRITNDTDAPIQAMLEIQDWKRDDTGANEFLPLGSTAGSCGAQLKVFPSTIRIEGHRTEAVRVAFEGAATKSCWAIVFIQSNERPKPSSRQSQISYVVRTGVKVYVEPEKAVKAGDVDSVGYTTMAASATDTSKVPALQVLFRNTGEAHLKPTGALEVRTTDNKIVASLPIGEFPIAPGDARRITLKVPKLPAGHYIALALIDFGGADIAAGQSEFEVR